MKNDKVSTEAIKNIVIYSGNSNVKDTLAGWQTALILAENLASTQIEIIHICQSDDDISALQQTSEQPTGSIITLHAEQLALLRRLGINELQLLTVCQAQPNLGNIYQRWSTPDQSFALVDGEYGVNFQQIEFQHYLASLQSTTDTHRIDDFSLAALMAKNNCFVHPSADKRSILSTFDYRLNVDMHSYCRLLAGMAKKLGVQICNGAIVNIEKDDSQCINTLHCQKVTGDTASVIKVKSDFLINCATTSILTSKPESDTRKPIYTPIHHTFSVPLVATKETNTADILTRYSFGFTKVRALKNQRILQCYYSQNSSITSVLDELAADHVELAADIDVSLIDVQKFATYLDQQAWQENCLLLGNASASFDPINDDFIALLHQDILAWLQVFPKKNSPKYLSSYYNSTRYQRYLSVIDFIHSHYFLSHCANTTFWRFETDELSQQLQHLLEVFSQTGVMVEYEQQYINEKKWIAFLIGFHCIPAYYDPLIDHNSQQHIAGKLTALYRQINQFAQQLPSYKAYIDHQSNAKQNTNSNV